MLNLATSAGWSEMQPNELNDLGQTVGTGPFDRQQRAFVLSPRAPVPEPSLALMRGPLGGGAVFGVARRGKHQTRRRAA